ncbi:MAG: hypothetical protein M3Q18_07665 [Actinomycetota bacterium]|nr:hypothetical protein [Actinomycetota bacterium]
MLGAIEIAVIAAVVGGLAIALWRSLNERQSVERWARDSGLRLTSDNRAYVAAYLRRTRMFRLVGGLIGLFLPWLAVTNGPLPKPFDFGLFDALLGYLLGALVAELSFKRPQGEFPSASLVPRSVSDYLARWYRISLRVGAGLGLGLTVWYDTLPDRETSGPGAPPPAIVLVVMIVGAWLTVELFQRYIVARRQPAVDLDLVRADDAIRSASIHALAGAGLALELLVASVMLGEIAGTFNDTLTTWSLGGAAVVLFGSALGSWFHLTRPFERRELHPPGGEAVVR